MKTRPSAAELALAAGAVLALCAPSRAAAPADCAAVVGRALAGKDADAGPCLAVNAVWTDAGGEARGREAALARLKLLAGQLRWDGAAPRATTREGLTLLSGGYIPRGKDTKRWAVVDLDGPPPYAAVTVYTGARDWPAPAQGPAGTDEGADTILSAFNNKFSSGDVDGWLSYWRPDALFISFIFPIEGSGIHFFFQHQAKRYVKPKLVVERRWLAAGGEHLFQGHIRGTCRESGHPFDLPLFLLVRLQEKRVKLAYEVFSVEGDGCGPFMFRGDPAAGGG